MNIMNYTTGEFLRTATPLEAEIYLDSIEDQRKHWGNAVAEIGVVDGGNYGVDVDIYMD